MAQPGTAVGLDHDPRAVVVRVAIPGVRRPCRREARLGGIATPDARVFAPGSAERLATQLITNEWERGRQQNYHEFLAEGEGAFGREWIDAATSDTVNLRLTADELRAVARDVEVVVQGYIDRFRGNPSPGARPVQLHLNAFPLVRGAVTEDDARTEDDAPTEEQS